MAGRTAAIVLRDRSRERHPPINEMGRTLGDSRWRTCQVRKLASGSSHVSCRCASPVILSATGPQHPLPGSAIGGTKSSGRDKMSNRFASTNCSKISSSSTFCQNPDSLHLHSSITCCSKNSPGRLCYAAACEHHKQSLFCSLSSFILFEALSKHPPGG